MMFIQNLNKQIKLYWQNRDIKSKDEVPDFIVTVEILVFDVHLKLTVLTIWIDLIKQESLHHPWIICIIHTWNIYQLATKVLFCFGLHVAARCIEIAVCFHGKLAFALLKQNQCPKL